MRLIDADALHINITCGRMNGKKEFADAVKAMIDHAPTVDAVPVRHGKWIRDEFGARCSDCGLYAYRDKFDKPWESPYCPICGVKMDGERKEE